MAADRRSHGPCQRTSRAEGRSGHARRGPGLATNVERGPTDGRSRHDQTPPHRIARRGGGRGRMRRLLVQRRAQQGRRAGRRRRRRPSRSRPRTPVAPRRSTSPSRSRRTPSGTLTVKILNDYPAETPANEARLARDIRAGKVDFGVLPARAWAPAGVEAFDALQAPFVLGSYDVARAAIAGPAGSALTQALEKAGVTALGLVPAELRRVLSVRPLPTPDAFRGMSIRIADNDTSAAVVRSLGATPVEGVTADDVSERLKSDTLSGAETAPIWAVEQRLRRGGEVHDRLRAVRPRRHAGRLAGRVEAALQQPAGRRDRRGQGHDRLHLHAPRAGARQPRRAVPRRGPRHATDGGPARRARRRHRAGPGRAARR